jgi:beta-phosphoglucomutase-like phosphatase (HAD superfamily)
MYNPYYFKERSLGNLLKTSRLVVFDMNGLMIDDEEYQLKSVNLTIREFGVILSESYWIKKCLGKRADEYYPQIMKNFKIDTGKYSVPALVNKKNRLYRDLVSGSVIKIVRPGVISFINYLLRYSIHQTALVTSALSDEIATVIGSSGLGLEDAFKYVISGSDVEKCKPDPQAYMKVSELSGIGPAQCLVFEDSEPGINAAYGAQMRSIAVPNRFTSNQDFTNAEYVIDSLRREARVLSAPPD